MIKKKSLQNYSQKLDDERWFKRRNEIVIRDKNTCQSCRNFKLIESSLIADISDIQIVLIKDNLYKIIFYESAGFVELLSNLDKKIQEDVIIYYQKDGVSKKDLKLNAIRSHTINEKIKSLNELYLQIDEHFKTDSKRYEVRQKLTDNLNYLESSKGDKNEFTWLKVNNLHVHHKYYQLGLEPWEYPDNALTTLCEYCHHELHENQKVDVLDVNGNKFDEYTPCCRCFGEGYLYKYNYYMEGICFRCNGERYDEKILHK